MDPVRASMHKSRRLVTTFALAIASSGSACADDDLLPGGVSRPDIVWEGQHVRVGTDLELEAWCPGTLEYLDSYTGALTELFGLPDPDPVTYYLLPYPLPPGLGSCQRAKDGCTYEGSDSAFVMAAHLPIEHEVVHAVGALGRELPKLLEEGAATYWAEPLVVSGDRVPSDLDLRTTLDLHWNDVSGHQQRTTAAHFVSYLVHRWGMDAYRRRTTHRPQAAATSRTRSRPCSGPR